MNERILVHATASRVELLNGEVPRNVQWMPPGKQVVQPMGFEEPFEMEVTPAIASIADSQLQQLRAQATAGEDVEPYGDFNHKDEERAFKALRFFWGGDDPKSGGVRMEVAWTGAGEEAIKKGMQSCISPTWLLNKITKAFLGIAHNVGGLVPRSAFHSIQVFAKAEANNQPTTKGPMNEKQACELGAKAYESSAAALRNPTKETHAAAGDAHQAASDAFNQIPNLFRETGIHSKISAYHHDNVQEAPEGQVNDRLTAAARAHGKARGIKNDTDALAAYLRTPQGNRDYEQFRNNMILGRK